MHLASVIPTDALDVVGVGQMQLAQFCGEVCQALLLTVHMVSTDIDLAIQVAQLCAADGHELDDALTGALKSHGLVLGPLLHRIHL